MLTIFTAINPIPFLKKAHKLEVIFFYHHRRFYFMLIFIYEKTWARTIAIANYWFNTIEYHENDYDRTTHDFCNDSHRWYYFRYFWFKILLMIVLRLLGINISVSIIFSYHAIIETLVLISVAYLLVIIQSYIFIRKRSISELASDLTKKK